jgi:phage-related minor tail protein
MATRRGDGNGPAYVLKVGEDNRRYAQDLLSENERLRFLVASLDSERLSLVEKVADVDRLLQERDTLGAVVASLRQDQQRLEAELLRVCDERSRHERDRDELRDQLADIERQNRRFSEEYVEVEKRNNNLMSLYVASYRLHGTVNRKEVLDTIQEIVANLVGCEEQAVFEVEGGTLRLIASVGIDPEAYGELVLGEGAIGRAALEGTIYVPGPGKGRGVDEGLTACIPLKLEGEVTGAIALFGLLPQKPALEDVDHELFELLATHAATALYCTQLHQRAQASAGETR